MAAKVINISPPSEAREDVTVFDVSDDELQRAAEVGGTSYE